MQRQHAPAGCTRTTRRGVPPTPALSEPVSEETLSRLSPSYDPEHRFGQQAGRIDSLTIHDLTWTGHLTGERLA